MMFYINILQTYDIHSKIWGLLKKNVYIYPTTQLQEGCDTRSIFKFNKATLNLEFSFS